MKIKVCRMDWMHRIAASLARGGFVFFGIVAIPAIGDDAVGIARVETGTNAVTAVEMPFEPLGEGHPADYISGDFAGDGGADSDMIHRRAVSTGGAPPCCCPTQTGDIMPDV